MSCGAAGLLKYVAASVDDGLVAVVLEWPPWACRCVIGISKGPALFALGRVQVLASTAAHGDAKAPT